MPSPFPGMDPYIERPAIWGDFHDSLITCIRGQLQPLLKPRYAAVTRDRLYVVESDRPIIPDVAIVRTSRPSPGVATAAVAAPDTPAVFELWREEMRETLIQIIEPAEDNRIVTTIEVLSPSNKTPGAGRDDYLRKREEVWRAGANFVEIDLLRAGNSTVRLSQEKLATLKPHHYLAAVTRRWPSRQEVYAIALQQPLPKIAIPLGTDDKDVTLDLPAAFTRCWDESAYPELLHYENPPPGTLTAEEIAWCDARLQAAGLRAATTT